MFGNKICSNAPGQAAFNKLVNAVREAAGMDTSIQTAVLATPIPNAFALPGGKVYLFSGLLAKAENPDEIAGVLAHEFGHLQHRDNTRNLIYNGGTSFLIGLLFGDVTGSGALIFASRSLVTASYSREAEQDADTVFDRCDAPARPADQSRWANCCFASPESKWTRPVHSVEPSADRRPAEADERRRSAAERPAVADGGRMGVAEGDLHRK